MTLTDAELAGAISDAEDARDLAEALALKAELHARIATRVDANGVVHEAPVSTAADLGAPAPADPAPTDRETAAQQRVEAAETALRELNTPGLPQIPRGADSPDAPVTPHAQIAQAEASGDWATAGALKARLLSGRPLTTDEILAHNRNH